MFMNNVLTRWYCWLILGLMGCQSLPQPQQLPETTQNSQVFKIEQLDNKAKLKQQSLLVLQYLPNQWRWVQTDPLGAPLARVVLTSQGWQNDGFVMPNPQAKRLFSAIATALYPDSAIFSFSAVEQRGEKRIYFIEGRTMWSLKGTFPELDIILADNSHWRVVLLN